MYIGLSSTISAALADKQISGEVATLDWNLIFSSNSLDRHNYEYFPQSAADSGLNGEPTSLYSLDTDGTSALYWYNHADAHATNILGWLTPGAGLAPQLSFAAGGAAGLQCWSFNGTSQYLVRGSSAGTASVLSDWMPAATGWVATACIIDPQTFTNDANIYDNVALWGDNGGFVGVHFKSDGNIYAYGWDGSAQTSSLAFTPGVPCVIEWCHTGGLLWISVNGQDGASASLGSISSRANHEYLAAPNLHYLQCKVFEQVSASDVPTRRRDIVQDMLNWIT